MFYPLARINGDKNRKGCVCKNLETFKELIGVYLRRIDLKLRTKETRVSLVKSNRKSWIRRSYKKKERKNKKEGRKNLVLSRAVFTISRFQFVTFLT